ncbi:sensor histidine kinase [Streptomyces sp. NPDC058171]
MWTSAEWLGAGLVVSWVGALGLGCALLCARRKFGAVLEQRGQLVERERENAARSAADTERTRIAAELHDIVSHDVSLMVVQAGAAREILPTMPDEAAVAMTAVETAGRRALAELRQLVGLLAPARGGEDDSDGIALLSPQPGLSRLSPLIDSISFAGLPVELRVCGEPRALPAAIDVTAYRIIQEALTNALEHGHGARAEVTVRYADHCLRVEVLNSGPSVLIDTPPAGFPKAAPAAGGGRGLVGLRERVAVYGGDLDARRRLGGGYRVRARIPLDRS